MPDTQAKFTPGPWVVDLDKPLIGGGDVVSVLAINPAGLVTREICIALMDTDDYPNGPDWSECAANVNLIAAAPSLRDAARFALSVLKANPVELSERIAIDRLESALAIADYTPKEAQK